MAVIKCKMCGGDLRIEEGTTVCECEYCGTRQTVPNTDSEKKLTLFSRAGRLLRGCEFDKAAGVFETLVADYPEEAEAYWGLVLCKYGIEYVDDPATGKKVPTCHRSSFDSVMKDPNFEQACENTDAVARRVYRDEARAIEELRKRIIEVSGKEEPYDVFISYKEKDENGERTQDSVLAQDIYRELTRDGLRVFFSRISLENKLGMEYEPYIFAALNSAKVMLVVGTDYENFDSVWVKNEWGRYLKLIAAGQKKTLIPVLRNMDAYDMPEEISRLAAQDMGKVGAMQDLVHAVEKLVGKKQDETAREPVRETVVVQQAGGPNTAALLKRGQQALEDGDWGNAKGFYDQVLNMDAENAEAFFGLFLTGAKCVDEREYIGRVCGYPGERQKLSVPADEDRIEETVGKYALKGYLEEDELRKLFQYDLRYVSFTREDRQQRAEQQKKQIRDDRNYTRAVRFAKGETAVRLDRFKADIVAGLDAAVSRAAEQETEAAAAKQKEYAAFLADAEKKAEELNRQAAEKREAEYQELCARADAAGAEKACLAAAEEFRSRFPDYRDSAERIRKCETEAARLRILAEKAAKENQAKQKRAGIIAGIVAIVAIAAILIVTKVVIPSNQYKAAEALFAAGQYEEAIAAFEAMNGYKDSAARIEDVNAAILARDYAAAKELLKAGKNEEAIEAFNKLSDFGDSAAYIEEAETAIQEARYISAETLLNAGQFDAAVEAFGALGDYKDSTERASEAQYAKAEGLLSAGDKAHAALAFYAAGNFKDAKKRSFDLWSNITQRQTISAGKSHTVGIRTDGTVIAAGLNDSNQCNVSDWKDIVAVAAGCKYTVGLKSDGTVVAVGDNDDGQCNVSDWKDIVAISTESDNYNIFNYTLGLKADGTIISTSGRVIWPDTEIVAFDAGASVMIGLTADGSVVVDGNPAGGNNIETASEWRNVVSVAAGDVHVLGLKADGKVVSTEYYGWPDRARSGPGLQHVGSWSNIKAVSAGKNHSVGLKKDGTVISTSISSAYKERDYGQTNVSGWKNVVAVVTYDEHTVGLLSNGKVVAVGNNSDGQCDVSDWTDIKLPNT